MPDTPAGTPSVRLALPGEAAAIAAVQRRAWSADPVLADALEPLGLDEMTAAWWRAIATPPLAEFRVLVALEPGERAPLVRGFAAIGPSEDEDADPHDALVAEFVVDPEHRGAGHGSRLLNAVADTLRADRFTRATWWLRSTDDALRTFLVEAGWGPDGAHRESGSEDGSIRIKEIRLHSDISDSDISDGDISDGDAGTREER